jgi:Ca2+/H+ antiporter
MTELSLSISIGSASQVGMIVAPCAVFFGVITGNPVTLDFAGLPWGILILSLFGAYLTLRDNRWNINEGVALLALYLSVVVAFVFAR